MVALSNAASALANANPAETKSSGVQYRWLTD
jgi:hypothetical protein